MTPRERLELQVFNMQPGQCLKLRLSDFSSMYLDGWSTSRGLEAARDAFLSRCVGSAYGVVRCEIDVLEQTATIRKFDADPTADHSGFVYYVDSDRRDLFDRVPNGWRRKPKTPPDSAPA